MEGINVKQLNLGIKDRNRKDVLEGSILGIMTTRAKGYSIDGLLIKKKVVLGRANTENSDLGNHIGFWAVDLDCENSSFEGVFNYYESVTSVQYLIDSNGAEVIGSVYDEVR